MKFTRLAVKEIKLLVGVAHYRRVGKPFNRHSYKHFCFTLDGMSEELKAEAVWLRNIAGDNHAETVFLYLDQQNQGVAWSSGGVVATVYGEIRDTAVATMALMKWGALHDSSELLDWIFAWPALSNGHRAPRFRKF